MKSIFTLLFISTLFVACTSNSTTTTTETGNSTEETSPSTEETSPSTEETSPSTEAETATIAGNYGDTDWSTDGAISGTELLASLEEKDSIYTTVSGTIAAACKKKGCWMNMDMDGTEMIVKFKDYGFFVPKNSADHDATMKGWAYKETVSVAEQIEIANDAEESEEEIAKISEPVVKLTFMADGVVIK